MHETIKIMCIAMLILLLVYFSPSSIFVENSSQFHRNDSRYAKLGVCQILTETDAQRSEYVLNQNVCLTWGPVTWGWP